jgi:hypothetical protein
MILFLQELRKRAKLELESRDNEKVTKTSKKEANNDTVNSDSEKSGKENNCDSVEKTEGKNETGLDVVDGGKIQMETDMDDFDKNAIYSEAVKKTVRLINGEVAPEEQPDLFSGGVLRRYQVDGYLWLKVSGLRNLTLGVGSMLRYQNLQGWS